MNTATTSSPSRRARALALLTAAVVLGATACQSSSSDGDHDSGGGDRQTANAARGDAKPHKLLWMGDSIGEAEAPALGAALKASGSAFASMAATGGGGVVGEISAPTWKKLPQQLTSFKPDVVAYQITTYDWGTPAQQRAGYERLAKTVNDAGADLVIVSAPPFELDDFYKPHAAAIKSAPESARAVAARHARTVHFFDASALWGTDNAAAKAQRSKDGIHSCQQGSAAFAVWLGKELARQYGFTPAAPETWATASWTGEKVYDQLGCA
jgi:hypothetical protein